MLFEMMPHLAKYISQPLVGTRRQVRFTCASLGSTIFDPDNLHRGH